MVRTSWEIIHKKSFQLFWANSVGFRSANWSGDGIGFLQYVLFGLGGGSSVCLGGAIKL